MIVGWPFSRLSSRQPADMYKRFLMIFLSVVVCAGLKAQTSGIDTLAAIFLDPPHDARPQVWWHWMDGNVSKEGVRKDLEWMKRQGFGGFHQFDAGGINMPRAAKVRQPYLSEGWKDVFRYALRLADSLGLDATIASAPGWSSTGGPWVKPEDAVKKLEWKIVDVKGGKVRMKMPDLDRTVGPYQDYYQENDRVEVQPYGDDICVIAVRRPREDRNLEELGGRTTVTDSVITVSYPQPVTVKSLTLKSMAMGGRSWGGKTECRNFLECSMDGKAWRRVTGILPARIPYATVDIQPVTARHFRVRGEKLASLDLYTVTRINHSEEQAGFSNAFDFNKFRTPDSDSAISVTDVIDISSFMGSDGTLKCSLPKGRWRIYRFGWSITGKVNHPASPEATGLEVDKLDKEAWMDYFHKYLDLYKEASGGMLGSNGIKYLLTDSYEAGSFTWTRTLPEEFERRCGYSLLPWLPVLAGEIMGSTSRSEAFLKDWRRTLGELFCENYARINDIVKEYGLEGWYCETHEGGRAYMGDGMDPKINATIPMGAIWMENTPTGSSVASAIADIKESASAAHLYGKKLVAAESFSVNGDEGRAYTYCPENMKYIADVALSAGLNRFVIHESASQPNDSYLPGMQLFRYGQWLHRNETWGEYAHVLTSYLARSSALLQQGRAVADILLYYGEDSNVCSLYGGPSSDFLPDIPQGYDYDFANPTVLMSAVRAETDPRSGTVLVSDSGARYKILWLDKNCDIMSEKVMERLSELEKAGVKVCLKGELGEALKDIRPDFEGPEGFRYVHRQSSGEDIYWVRNFSGSDCRANLRFRDTRRYAYLFDPAREEVRSLGYDDGISQDMLSTDALFIVFSDEPISGNIPGYEAAGEDPETLIAIDSPWEVRFVQKGGGEAEERFGCLRSWTESLNPVVKYFSGTAVYRTIFTLDKEDLAGSGSLILDLGSVKNIAEVSVNGRDAGILWKAPFRTGDLRPLLHDGENCLEIKVTNVWRNRMIGDVQPGEQHPVTAIRRFYKAGDPLLPSGLLGPVSILKY